jgi:hypothetical protein
VRLHRLLASFLLLGFAIPIYGQVQPQSEVESLLRAASKALDHYQKLAPGIHCEEATSKEFRDTCKLTLETLAERTQEAEAEIALYRQRSTPQITDLFDAYESFRRVMAVVEDVNYTTPASYGEHNKRLFAEAYNTFVKVNGWFGGVVRIKIQDAERCYDHGHT